MSEIPPLTAPETPLSRAIRGAIPDGCYALLQRSPFVALSLRVFALLAFFVAFRHSLFSTVRLDEALYAQHSLVASLARAVGVPGLIGIALVAAGLSKYGGLNHGWQAIDDGAALRWFVGVLAAAVSWPLATCGFNYYFDQGHYVDRTLLVLLVPLLLWRPLFVIPFVTLAFTMLWQFGVPDLRAGAVFPHKLQVLNILIFFSGFFVYHALTGTRRKDDFLFLSACAVAASYWFPALTKIELGWWSHGGLYKMLPAAYAHGWLAFLEPEVVVKATHLVATFDWPMRVFVLFIEAACLFFLARRGITLALLPAVIVFHLGVFALYGYLFWTWIVVDAALFWLFWRDRNVRRIGIYSRAHLALSVLLITGAGHWSHPAKLGWFDTGLTYTFHYEAVGTSGARYRLSPRFFEPYGDVFTMANFDYLIDSHRALVHPYGITSSRARANGLNRARTPEAVFALERELGRNKYDAIKAARFRAFVTRYITNWNARGATASFIESVAAPMQFWSFVPAESYRGQEPIAGFIAREVTTFFDEASIRQIRTRELMRITIAEAKTSGAYASKPE